MRTSLATGHSYSIGHLDLYILLVLGFGLAIRVIMIGLRSMKMTLETGVHSQRQTFTRNFLRNLSGFVRDHQYRAKYSDFWFPFIVGLLELATFPLLMAFQSWTAIGGWIGLKALAQWKVWGDDRAVFNLFLIGCGLNIIASLIIWDIISDGSFNGTFTTLKM